MSSTTKELIQAAALRLFDEHGVAATSIAQIRSEVGISNGSFFHAYKTRDSLCADIYLLALKDYHAALVADLPKTAQDGIAALITAHLEWVVTSGPLARFLFKHARPEWLDNIRAEQASENAKLAESLATWRAPLAKAGALHPMPEMMFFAQLIGPAQIFCRAWLSGRYAEDPRTHAQALIDSACRVLTLTPDQ
ncbi:TetR/AcrR family transcriptional regulator [Falsiruegeria mediterranea]